MKSYRLIAAATALALLAVACGGSDGVEVEKPWARASAMVDGAGAAYMQISSPDADRLIGVSVDATVAAMAEIHETSMNDEGAMMMSEVGRIDIPAGETVMLEPGGYHIMLMQLAEPLEPGNAFDLTLQFAEGGDITVEVEVREEAP